MPDGAAAPGACADCGSPLEHGQRYCLGCGERLEPRSPQLLELLRRMRGPAAAGDPRRARASTQPQRSARPRRPALAASAPARLRQRRSGGFPRGASRRCCCSPFSASVWRSAVSPVDPRTTRWQHRAGRNCGSCCPRRQPSATAAAPTGSEAPTEAPAVVPEVTPEAAAPAAGAAAPASRTPARAPASGGGEQKGKSGAAPRAPTAAKLPAIKHVFVIMLSDRALRGGLRAGFGAPYLSHTLEQRGELLVRYYAVAHEQLANEIALLSGQGPTPATARTARPTVTWRRGAPRERRAGSPATAASIRATTATLPGQLTGQASAAGALTCRASTNRGAQRRAVRTPRRGAPTPARRTGSAMRLRELPQPVPLLPLADRLPDVRRRRRWTR